MNAETFVKMMKACVAKEKPRSAWEKGVLLYANDLLDSMEFDAKHGYFTEDHCLSSYMFDRYLLNGACTWYHYSDSGCSLICDADIAKRLCTPSEWKKTNGGKKPPNEKETWLHVQGRALYQASHILKQARRDVKYFIDETGGK